MKTTRQEDRGPRRARQAGLLLALCAVLAGCGSQAAGDADKTPGAHATAYLLFPLTLAASPHGDAGTDKAVEGAAHVARHAAPAEDMAPAAAVSIGGSRAAVVRGINQNEEIVGSYRLASGGTARLHLGCRPWHARPERPRQGQAVGPGAVGGACDLGCRRYRCAGQYRPGPAAAAVTACRRGGNAIGRLSD